MAKMHKLIQNEYIKTGKKVTTKVIFILIAVSVLALMGLGKFAQYAINENMDYIYEDTIDYSYEINEAEKMQYPGYETDIERMNFIMDNNFQYGSWQMSASYEIFSYETGEHNNVIHTFTEEERTEFKKIVVDNNWKKYCEYIVKNGKKYGYTDAELWQYQYRLANDIPLPANTIEGFTYPNDVIESVSYAKMQLANSAEMGMGEKNNNSELEDQIALGLYRLENDIKVNVADSTSIFVDYNIGFWNIFGQSASLITVIGVLIIVIAGSTISEEFSHGTIKFLLINPVKRWKILVAKYAMCVSLGFIMIVLLYVLSVIFSMIFFGVEDIGCQKLTISNGILTAENGFAVVFKNYMFRSVQVLVMATLAFAISSLCKNSALSIGVSLFAMLSGNGMVSLLKKNLNIDWVRYTVFANTDLSAVIDGSTGFANHSLGFAIAVVVIHLVVFWLIAWDGFTKREIQ